MSLNPEWRFIDTLDHPVEYHTHAVEIFRRVRILSPSVILNSQILALTDEDIETFRKEDKTEMFGFRGISDKTGTDPTTSLYPNSTFAEYLSRFASPQLIWYFFAGKLDELLLIINTLSLNETGYRIMSPSRVHELVERSLEHGYFDLFMHKDVKLDPNDRVKLIIQFDLEKMFAKESEYGYPPEMVIVAVEYGRDWAVNFYTSSPYTEDRCNYISSLKVGFRKAIETKNERYITYFRELIEVLSDVKDRSRVFVNIIGALAETDDAILSSYFIEQGVPLIGEPTRLSSSLSDISKNTISTPSASTFPLLMLRAIMSRKLKNTKDLFDVWVKEYDKAEDNEDRRSKEYGDLLGSAIVGNEVGVAEELIAAGALPNVAEIKYACDTIGDEMKGLLYEKLGNHVELMTMFDDCERMVNNALREKLRYELGTSPSEARFNKWKEDYLRRVTKGKYTHLVTDLKYADLLNDEFIRNLVENETGKDTMNEQEYQLWRLKKIDEGGSLAEYLKAVRTSPW